MLCRRYRDRISLVEFINCVMASGARLPVQIEKNPRRSLSLSLCFRSFVFKPPLVRILLIRVQEDTARVSPPPFSPPTLL